MEKVNELECFCNNVKYLRMKHGLTQSEMATRLQISVRSLRIIEHGTMPPRLGVEVLFTLSESFNIPLTAALYPLY